MSIERVQRLELAFPASRRDDVLAVLHQVGIVHLDPPGEEVLSAGAEPVSVPVGELDARVAALSSALELISEHCPAKKTLVESFFGAPVVATREELTGAATGVNHGEVGRTAEKLRERWRRIGKFEADARAELSALEPFLDFPFTSRDLVESRRLGIVLGTMSAEGFNDLRLDLAAEALAWEEVRRRGKTVWVLAAFAAGQSEAARARLDAHGFEELPFPHLAGTAAERAEALRHDLDRVAEERDAVRREVAKLASDRREFELALAYWEDRRELKAAAAKTAECRRLGVLVGYLRERDRARLDALLGAELGFCSARLAEPEPAEDVPVSIRLPGWLRPMQLLINMFGLPHYRAVDPTPYLTLSFLVFFGCCFGDVIYGLVLCAISLYVMVRYKHAAWTRGFFQFFLYAGVFATLFGLITGSWMGDLLTNQKAAYVSAGNPLARLARACMLIDPLQKSLLALLIALGMGVANQFLGIFMKIKLELGRRDLPAAAFDGGLWLVFLPGMMLTLAPLFVSVPYSLRVVGWFLLGAGSLGLVLTQGRREDTWLGKALTGVVSLYGIMGNYGATSFIGDVLSYSRLLALGLTTTIIANSINILVGLFREVPMFGPLLFVVLLVPPHVVNFFMNILGAFVHPARLTLLEFFNRFYEGGGREFLPLAFRSERVALLGGQGAPKAGRQVGSWARSFSSTS